MSKIKDKIQAYINGKSKFGIATDIVFFMLLIALLIPASRMEVIVFTRKLIMFQPRIESQHTESLDESDYAWNYQSLDGEVISFNDLRGKVVFLNLWATWCPHCVAEFPSIQSLYDQHGNEMAFILLTNESPEKVKAFMDKEGYTFPVFLTYQALPEALDSRSIPATFLISRDGEIRINKTGAANWNGDHVHQLIAELLAK